MKTTNMKKSLSIGLLLVFTFTLFPLQVSRAEEEDLFLACAPEGAEVEEELVLFEEAYEEWQDNQTQKGFQETFELAQKTYHDYLSCLFETAFAHVLKQKENKTKGNLSAQINSVNWMLPGQACLAEEDLIASIEATSPLKVMTRALGAFEEYQDFFHALAGELREGGSLGEDFDPSSLGNFSTGVGALNQVIRDNQRRIDNELESSEMALDMAFTALKELRMSFVLHVRFQCVLNHLGSYQKMLGQVRGIIEGLPNALKNASVNP